MFYRFFWPYCICSLYMYLLICYLTLFLCCNKLNINFLWTTSLVSFLWFIYWFTLLLCHMLNRWNGWTEILKCCFHGGGWLKLWFVCWWCLLFCLWKLSRKYCTWLYHVCCGGHGVDLMFLLYTYLVMVFSFRMMQSRSYPNYQVEIM